MSVHQQIGKKIRLARKQAGMTQIELAKKLGKTGAAVAYLEQGKRRISTDVLTLIAHATSKQLSFFYEDDQNSELQAKKQLADLRQHLDAIKILLDNAEKDKKDAENKLQLFRTLLDQSNDVIAIWDPETGRALDCNGRLTRDLGYTREEFLKKYIFEIETGIPNLDAWKGCVREAKKMKSFLLPTNPVSKKGKVTPVEVSVSYVTVDDRDYIVVIARDLQDRKQQEEQFSQQLRQPRMLLESHSLGVFFADLQGTVKEVNAVLWDVFGVPAHERSEHDFSFLTQSLQKAGVFELIQVSLETLRESSKVFHFTSLWNKPLSLNIRIIPMKYVGYVMGVQGVVERVKGKA